jgi:hypothetical protein
VKYAVDNLEKVKILLKYVEVYNIIDSNIGLLSKYSLSQRGGGHASIIKEK